MSEAIMYIAAIKMPPGKLAAQVAHAAVACFREASACIDRGHIFRSWDNGQTSAVDAGQAKVVLRLDDESAQALAAHCLKNSIPIAVIHDEGRTVLAPGTRTAIAVGPVMREEDGPWKAMKLY